MRWVIISVIFCVSCSNPELFYRQIAEFKNGSKLIEIEMARGQFSDTYVYAISKEDELSIIGTINLHQKPYSFTRRIVFSNETLEICILNQEAVLNQSGNLIKIHQFNDYFKFSSCEGIRLDLVKSKKMEPEFEEIVLKELGISE